MANHHKSIIFHLLLLCVVVSRAAGPAGKPAVTDKADFDATSDSASLKINPAGIKDAIELLTKRSTVQRLEIAKAYNAADPNKLTNDIVAVLTDDKSKELVRALMSTLPEYYATEFEAALPKIDAEAQSAIIDMLFAISDEGIKKVNDAFKINTATPGAAGRTIAETMPKSVMKNFFTQRLSLKRDESANVDAAKVDEDLETIRGEDVTTWASPDSKLFEILVTRNYQHLKALFDKNVRETPTAKNLEVTIADEITDPVSKKILLALVKYAKGSEVYFADRLGESLNNLSTEKDVAIKTQKHKDLLRIIVSRSEIDLGAIVVNYPTTHSSETLAQAIEKANTEFAPEYKNALLKLVGS